MTEYASPSGKRLADYPPEAGYLDADGDAYIFGGPDEYANRQDWDAAYQGRADYQDTMQLGSVRPGAMTGAVRGRHAYERGDGPRAQGGRRLLSGGLAGIAAVAVMLSVATLAARSMGAQASPLVVLGKLYIPSIPVPLRMSAITYLGSKTQPVLLLGLYLVIEASAAVIGIITVRKKIIGALCFGFFGLAIAAAVIVLPGSRPSDAIPSAIGGLAGLVALLLLVRVPLRSAGPKPAASHRRNAYTA
jgi:hypothetical protein